MAGVEEPLHHAAAHGAETHEAEGRHAQYSSATRGAPHQIPGRARRHHSALRPVPAINEGVDALVQGRADVTEYALNAAKVKEADAAVGVRHVSIDCSPEGERRLRAAVPGYYPRMVKAGTATAVIEDTCVIAYDLYVATGKAVPDALVDNALRAVWDGVDKLPTMHPVFKEFSRDRFVDVDTTLPYHPAAVRFYRARGVWTPQMEQAQQKLLSVNP
ncbi:MAG: hypothetical protein HY953_05965 [Candidatus Rokubacteria bacterium]|nr:hypothetical protein [Candidatus Rokubacteria bacterium]